MRCFVLILSLFSLLLTALAAEDHFDYQSDTEWDGVCNTGLKQSPINLFATSNTGTVELNIKCLL